MGSSNVVVIGKQTYEDALKFYEANFNTTDSVYTKLVMRCWLFIASREADYALDKEVTTYASYRHSAKLIDLCSLIQSRYITLEDLQLSSPQDAVTVLVHNYKENF